MAVIRALMRWDVYTPTRPVYRWYLGDFCWYTFPSDGERHQVLFGDHWATRLVSEGLHDAGAGRQAMLDG